ncbi:MAG: NUDIX domain-containing protein [Sulfitobacter sp.]
MRRTSPRLAVRGIIKQGDRLLLVNAWPDGKSDLLCAPGGGVDPGSSLPDNLRREIHEETGLIVQVGAPCLVNEFHDPNSDFHQVDIYFHCTIQGSAQIDAAWRDPENIVTERHWLTRAELAARRFKPDSLPDVAFGDPAAAPLYDPLEPLLR